MINQLFNKIIVLPVIMVALSCSPKKRQPVSETENNTEQLLVETNRILVKKDQQKIKGIISRHGWNMKESPTGLWYEVIDPGSGDSVKTNMRISLNYKVSLSDGTECYSSESDGIKTFNVGKGGVESGLEQGVLLLREGGKARFVLPPYLAHGLTGDGKRIPARAIIIYEVEIISTEKQ